MAITKEDEIFKGKSFSELLGDIYKNQTTKKKQIDLLVNELRPYMTSASEAAVIVPLIKEYLEIGVKNDDQLVKLAAVYQKMMSSENRNELMSANGIGNNGDGSYLTDEEKKELNNTAKEYAEQLGKRTISDSDIFDIDAELGKEVIEVTEKVELLKSELLKVTDEPEEIGPDGK